MELERPIQQPDKTYRVDILVGEPLVFTYPLCERGSHSTPPEEGVTSFLQSLATEYERFSKKWFPLPVPAVAFMSRITHAWNTGSHEPYHGDGAVDVRQVWRPEWLHVSPRCFTLYWVLQSVAYLTTKVSPDDGTDAIPLTQEGEMTALVPSQRLRALRKVRAARLQAAVARARAKELITRYYERYGDTELLNGDDVLSSEED